VASTIIRAAGVTVEVLSTGEEKIAADIKQMQANLKDTTSVLRSWRKRYLRQIATRFKTRGGTKKRWSALSLKSTIPLRLFSDITRIGTPPGYHDRRMGGTPLKILVSRMSSYKKSWLFEGTHHKEAMQPNAKQAAGASLTISNTSVKTVHEFGYQAKGIKAFRGKKVPARPVAWIVGDDEMLQAFLEAFDKHIWKGIKAGGLKGLIRQAASGIITSGGNV
jgi:hypothetical protein